MPRVPLEEKSVAVSACCISVTVILLQEFPCGHLVYLSDLAVASIYRKEEFQMCQQPFLHHLPLPFPSVPGNDKRVFPVIRINHADALQCVFRLAGCLLRRERFNLDGEDDPVVMPVQRDSVHDLQPVPHLDGAFESGIFQESGYFFGQSLHRPAKIATIVFSKTHFGALLSFRTQIYVSKTHFGPFLSF